MNSFTYSPTSFYRREFEKHKIGHLVTVKCRDVCKEGFGLSQVADAGNCTKEPKYSVIYVKKSSEKIDRHLLLIFCSFSGFASTLGCNTVWQRSSQSM